MIRLPSPFTILTYFVVSLLLKDKICFNPFRHPSSVEYSCYFPFSNLFFSVTIFSILIKSCILEQNPNSPKFKKLKKKIMGFSKINVRDLKS